MSRAARSTVHQPKRPARAVSRPHDPAERQADRAADVVARGGSVGGWSFGSVPVEAAVHREEAGGGKSTEDKLKEAGTKTGEALLETKAGKQLQARVEEDPLVKGATRFLDTTAGKVVAGGAVVAGAGALAAAKQPLPVQLPAIRLSRYPDVTAKVTVEGPMNAPSFVGVSLTFKETVPKGKAGPSEKERYAAETERIRAGLESIKPQAEKDRAKAEEDAAVARYLASQSQRFGVTTLIPLRPSMTPKTIEVPKQDAAPDAARQEDAPVQRAPVSDAPASDAAGVAGVDPGIVEAAVRGGGRPLDPATRRSMEARFGYDFGAVRVHDDAAAAGAAGALAARAFTVGQDIVFGGGVADASTHEGRHLLAHELAHVVQQARSVSPGEPERPRGWWRPGAPAPSAVVEALAGPSESIPSSLLRALPIDARRAANARVHRGASADLSTTGLDAAAYTAGHHIVIRADLYPPHTAAEAAVLAHELRHVARAGERGATGIDLTMRDEDDVEDAADDPTWIGQAGPGVRRHPLTKIGKWAVRRLSRPGATFISKHIAKHTRRIADKTIHTVFLKPRALRPMVRRAIEEAVQVAERNATAAAGEVIEEGAIRVTRQARWAPGKYRYVVQKRFAHAIGTKGEKILQVFLDQTGRIVTAFPADRFIAIGLSAGGLELLTARTADAAESVRTSLEREASLREAARAAAQDDDSWVDWIPLIGDLFGGNLNAGEDQELAADRERSARDAYVQRTVNQVVTDIQEDLQRSLGPDDLEEIRSQVRMILVSGLDVEADELEGDAP
jgi:Domain of unknown function (DUF4157)